MDQYRKRGATGWFQSTAEMERRLATGEMHWIVGDPQGCFEQLSLIEETVGADSGHLHHAAKDQPREVAAATIRLLGEEVLPRLTSAKA